MISGGIRAGCLEEMENNSDASIVRTRTARGFLARFALKQIRAKKLRRWFVNLHPIRKTIQKIICGMAGCGKPHVRDC